MSAMSSDGQSDASQAALRSLPSVDHLLSQSAVANLLDEYPRGEVTAAVRDVLDQRRTSLRAGQTPPIDTGSLALAIREALYKRSLPHLRRVINATA